MDTTKEALNSHGEVITGGPPAPGTLQKVVNLGLSTTEPLVRPVVFVGQRLADKGHFPL
jgi:hypothetical protein